MYTFRWLLACASLVVSMGWATLAQANMLNPEVTVVPAHYGYYGGWGYYPSYNSGYYPYYYYDNGYYDGYCSDCQGNGYYYSPYDDGGYYYGPWGGGYYRQNYRWR